MANKIVLAIVLVLGMVFPFVPFLVMIELFVLLIPMVMAFVLITLFLLGSYWQKESKPKGLWFAFAVIPVFILTQLVTVVIVNQVQRFRSESLITQIEHIEKQTGEFPAHYSTILGIQYVKMENQNNFSIEYERGFMVREAYYHDNKTWTSKGWND
jgi:hypothetical protein